MQLRRVNTLLLLAIIASNIYLVLLPFLPIVTFWTAKHFTDSTSGLQQKLTIPRAKVPASQENRLVIPGMLLDEPIIDGPDIRALDKGPWRRPGTSTPDQGGNTVVAGHRFTYTNPQGSFYHLDMVKIGDQVGVFWKGVRYVYIVDTVRTVKADEVSIEGQTTDPTLTLYTCTPLWLPKDRLVVIASLKETTTL